MGEEVFIPKGVPIRVYGGYLEARAALRANAPENASHTLRWLLSHIAEERGAPKGQSFPAKVDRLRAEGFISSTLEPMLFERAFSEATGPEEAWALMSIVEHAFYRLYMRA